MSAWNHLIQRVRDNGGVGTPALARAAGVPEATWHRRTRSEGWNRPYRGVRVAPWAPKDRRTDLRAAVAACHGHAVASGTTALWLLGLREEPRAFSLIASHRARPPVLDDPHVRVVTARWLDEADVRVQDGIALLRPEAIVVSLSGLTAEALRSVVIDMVQAGLTTVGRIRDRLARVGPITGRATLEAVVDELSGKRPESAFHDDMLEELRELGYPVEAAPRRIDTPDSRGVLGDLPIPAFFVLVDPQGDRFHRSRSERRADRRRVGQLAGTPWVVVPVDWRDWHDRRQWVLDTIDAAILRQLHAGHGTIEDLPPHLRERAAA